MKLSLVIPVYNEEELIPELYKRIIASLKKYFPHNDYEIILTDDGSTDETFRQLTLLHKKDKRVKCIQFSRNFGHHIAITAGLDIAKGDYIVMMDGDLQDQPEEIIKLYKKLQEGYDVVYAVRKNKKFGFLKKTMSNLFNIFIKKMIKEDIVINSTIFRIMTKQVNENMKLLKERNRYLVGIIGWIGFRHAPQPVEHGERFSGKTKYTLQKQINLALNAIFAYSNYPLHFIISIGFFFAVFFFLTAVIMIGASIIYHTHIIEWLLIVCAIFIIGGIQIIILGIIGEYVGRNYIEDKNRPLYLIKQLLL